MSAPDATGTPPAGDLLQHAVGFHDSPDDLVGQILALVRESRMRGDAVVLALAPATTATVRERLDAAEDIAICLDRPEGPAGLCGQSLAVRWSRRLEVLSADGPVTVIGQHDPDYDGPDGRFWTDLDAAVHVSMAHLPIRLVCFYPRMPLHQVVLDGAYWLHPLVCVDGRLEPNPEHRPVREVLSAIPAPAPELLGAPHHEMELGVDELPRIRTLVETVLRERDCPDDRLDDAILAINEVATNAVEHGRGPARLTLWAEPEGCVAEVHDRGELDDPLLGLVAPGPGQDRGWGLWVARQASDYLRVWLDEAGTHVRIHVTV
ncbi:anti-sigma regulatory factor (Ser/Thr protein kinase) [Pseudonocardia sediminis]|uniref:Anti-sigma regulatory factor (Ser/Thr protein kinase) n=1 Tax=Pseudonocardia sediminis TaxID=1397368 RepID=A0A4Q7UTI8_PSEST|nr:ATP-binding protein [Pseudonocardia sediminis]RZT85227.1 anti-sigma regulatory factor (Ser/Thr protein kinase) [Pseudonocardia sediminis]